MFLYFLVPEFPCGSAGPLVKFALPPSHRFLWFFLPFPFAVSHNQNPQGSKGEDDPNNTTIFVGGLDSNVTEDHLRQLFSHYGELVHVKIPVGKHCGFVQFANRLNAEQALSSLNGTQLGAQNIRLSWGRTPTNRQVNPGQTQWGGSYYGYTQGYESYGYAPPPQDTNMYYGSYPGFSNYQQPQQEGTEESGQSARADGSTQKFIFHFFPSTKPQINQAAISAINCTRMAEESLDLDLKL